MRRMRRGSRPRIGRALWISSWRGTLDGSNTSLPVPFMTGVPFAFWAFLCGALLARAHARSGDAARIAGYFGDGETLDRALGEFAEACHVEAAG
jgi:hypothetical protein